MGRLLADVNTKHPPAGPRPATHRTYRVDAWLKGVLRQSRRALALAVATQINMYGDCYIQIWLPNLVCTRVLRSWGLCKVFLNVVHSVFSHRTFKSAFQRVLAP